MTFQDATEAAPPWVGYLSAFVSCLAFGSFAVPIKGQTANRVHIDPLVMQTYKTVLCFLTSWVVLLLGERFVLTPWGLLSGLFWVPGGTAGIYAVRTAGLAVSQGMWSTLKIMVAFVWGMIVFDERVRSRTNASLAILLLMIGLSGMSYFSGYSSIRGREEESIAESSGLTGANDLEEPLLQDDQTDDFAVAASRMDDAGDEGNISHEEAEVGSMNESGSSLSVSAERRRQFGISITRRQLGMLCAVIDGLWGGSILVPMHYAGRDAEGLGYIISFAVGAAIVLSLMWCLRLTYNASLVQSWNRAYNELPSFHLGCMWLPGGVAGLLWSVGNITSVISVASLGELVGFSIVQAQLLVAGAWGVLWYREVQGGKGIGGWFLCAGLTLLGVVLLGHEHIESS